MTENYYSKRDVLQIAGALVAVTALSAGLLIFGLLIRSEARQEADAREIAIQAKEIEELRTKWRACDMTLEATTDELGRTAEYAVTLAIARADRCEAEWVPPCTLTAWESEPGP